VRLAAAAVFLLAAAPAAAQPKPFDIAAFFTGPTHADNIIKIAFHAPHKLIVDSVGHVEGKQFIQIDTVREEGKPVTTRKWVTHQVGPGHYAGTLSDATGPVDITVSGNTTTIKYTMQGGLSVVQTMQLQADGRSLSNSAVARKLGIKFATVQGTIRKLD
jgi:hypothetical protein